MNSHITAKFRKAFAELVGRMAMGQAGSPGDIERVDSYGNPALLIQLTAMIR